MRRLGLRCIDEERGTALLEMLLYLAVFSFLLPVVVACLVAVSQIWTDAVDRLEAREQAIMLVRRMEGEVREGHAFVAQAGRFSFLDVKGLPVQYQLGVGGMMLRNSGSSATVIGADVNSCQFSTEANGQSVHLLLTTKVGRAQETIDQVWTGRGDLP